MNQKGGDFLKKLLATFKVEAGEHVEAMSSGLLELEKASTAEKEREVLEAVFREAHSLKGAARAVNVLEVESMCQALESIFAAWKRKEVASSPALFDLLHKAVDSLGKLLLAMDAEPPVAGQAGIAELIQALEDVRKGALPPAPPRPETFPPPREARQAAETVRISTAKLDSLLLEAEELLSAKLASGQRAADLQEIQASLGRWQKMWAQIHSHRRTLERFAGSNGKTEKLAELLEQAHSLFQSLEGRLAALEKSAKRDHRSLGAMVDRLLEDMKKVLMLPASSLLESFPKFVRDLSRDRGKDVELVVEGGEIEIDRRILEEMKDPLLHLVRNSVDHGIEEPRERERRKKPRQGKILLAVARKNGDKVEIAVEDDGAGIQAAKVRAAGLKLGLLSPEEAGKMDDREALSLVFQSGVSTSPIITDISGRGLGLAIVREKVEKLGGKVFLETRPGTGTAFRIVLPLTLASFRGVLVRVDQHIFVLPTANVERVVRAGPEDIRTVENRETIPLDGKAVSLVRLEDALELPRRNASRESRGQNQRKALAGGRPAPCAGLAKTAQAVLLGSVDRRVAFVVDEILGEQEVLVKPLGRQLARVRNVAAATVLGTGRVAAVLNVSDLLKSAARAGAAPAAAAAGAVEAEAKRKSILIAEDSITARTLLKNILESAGYQVRTAVDGVDALTALKTEGFDAVVSDVDMPRMSGFDLTARIRADKKFAELPVVLVTALESREDRERGIDVGANAYIVKSSFDQSNLLEVLRRLL